MLVKLSKLKDEKIGGKNMNSKGEYLFQNCCYNCPYKGDVILGFGKLECETNCGNEIEINYENELKTKSNELVPCPAIYLNDLSNNSNCF